MSKSQRKNKKLCSSIFAKLNVYNDDRKSIVKRYKNRRISDLTKREMCDISSSFISGDYYTLEDELYFADVFRHNDGYELDGIYYEWFLDEEDMISGNIKYGGAGEVWHFNKLSLQEIHEFIRPLTIALTKYVKYELVNAATKRMHKRYFKENVEEELIAHVLHPRNYERFEGLGFFD